MLSRFSATGDLDLCWVLTFDEARSKETAEEFVSEVLAGVLRTRLVIVGADFHFGYRRHGDVPLLQRMGAELGFEVLGLGLVASPDGRAAPDSALPYSSGESLVGSQPSALRPVRRSIRGPWAAFQISGGVSP